MYVYCYKVRPEYGKENLLIEFTNGREKETFLKNLFDTLSSLDFKTTATTDLWMNDEVWLTISSTAGEFTLAKDIWDFVFILADSKSHRGIGILDECLCKLDKFEKVEADFSWYK